MDTHTQERLERLEQATKAQDLKLEIGDVFAGVAIGWHTFTGTDGDEIDSLTLQAKDGTYHRLACGAIDLKSKLVDGEFVAEWGDDGKPAKKITLGKVKEGEVLVLQRKVDSTSKNGHQIKRYHVQREGSPSSTGPKVNADAVNDDQIPF